jgi:hypothetical protein
MSQVTVGLIVVIGILGGFYTGAKYGQGHPPPSNTPSVVTSTATAGGAGGALGGGTAGGFGGGGGAGAFGAAAAGTITAVNGNVITVHDRTTNKDVKVDVSQGRISKTSQGTVADLTANTTVTVIGQTGADGTVSAQIIQIGGAIGRGQGAGATGTGG